MTSPQAATFVVTDSIDLQAAFRMVAEQLDFRTVVTPGLRVFLKPNLTYPTHRPGVTTSPSFIREAIRLFQSLGAQVTVGEGDGGYGAWPAETAFTGHGLDRICEETGARLVNLSNTAVETMQAQIGDDTLDVGMPKILLSETDLFVTLPTPKVHAMTHYSGAVKNQWGCIPDRMRLRFHPVFPDLIWAVNRAVNAHYVIADCHYMLDRSGPLEGDPVYMGRVAASNDILAFDIAVMERLMGMSPKAATYLQNGPRYGYRWQEPQIDDSSTGLGHTFHLQRSARHKLTAAAFPRQWAVDLLWFSKAGDLAHKVLYTVTGNPVAKARTIVDRQHHAEELPG